MQRPSDVAWRIIIQGPLLMKACTFKTHRDSPFIHFAFGNLCQICIYIYILALLHFCFWMTVLACLPVALVVQLPCSRERLMEKVTCCWAKEKQTLHWPGHAVHVQTAILPPSPPSRKFCIVLHRFAMVSYGSLFKGTRKCLWHFVARPVVSVKAWAWTPGTTEQHSRATGQKCLKSHQLLQYFSSRKWTDSWIWSERLGRGALRGYGIVYADDAPGTHVSSILNSGFRRLSTLKQQVHSLPSWYWSNMIKW